MKERTWSSSAGAARARLLRSTRGDALVLRYSYFHLFWLLRVSWGLKYSLATATEAGWATRPLSDEEAMQLDAPNKLTLNLWWRWGLVLWAAVAVVAIIIGNLTR